MFKIYEGGFLMNKRRCLSLVLAFSLLLCFLINIGGASKAEDLGSANIVTLVNIDNGNGGSSVQPVKGIVYGLIRVKEGLIDDNNEKTKLLEDLSNLSLEQLEKKYEKFGNLLLADPSDSQGRTEIRSMKLGEYYVVDIRKENGKWVKASSVAPFIMRVTRGSSITIYAKSNQPNDGKKIRVKKKWVGGKLNKVDIYLYADGKKINEVELSESNSWQYTFNNLNKVNSEGKEIKYTIGEGLTEGYTSKIEIDKEGVYTVTNTKKDNKIIGNTRENGSTGRKGGSIIKTGDWLIYFIVGLGLILMAVGYRVYRKAYK